jgi:major type 1 subunit fimbrin (pilin)
MINVQKWFVFSLLSLCSLGAHAVDGTINFTGNISAVTCTTATSVNGTAATAITLNTVGAKSLNSLGSVAGSTAFTITASACTTTATATYFTPYFEAGTNINYSTGQLLNTTPSASGGATNVEIVIKNANGVALDLRKNTPALQGSLTSTAITSTTGAGTAAVSYTASYVNSGAVGSVTAGTVTASLTYSLVYN